MALVTIDASEAGGPSPRGWGRYVSELIGALRAGAAGPDLEVRALRRGGRLPEAAWEQLGLPLRARALGADVLHAPNCFLPLRRSCPGVVTIHDLAFEAFPRDFGARTGFKYRAVTPRAARSAERVICVSEFTAADVEQRYGVARERLRVVPQAPALARGDAPPPVGAYLLGVGDLRAKKDFATLVRAWLALRREQPALGLVIAGADAGEAATLRTLAGEAPLELPGYVSDERLDALLRGARALVHPSRYEGFGLVLLEAMARDTPVLAARATALPETGGEAAVYFEPGDHAELADALRGVLEDSQARAGLVARGRGHVARFTWQATARATAAVYRELLG